MAAHPDAVEAARRTNHLRFLELCDPDHPDYDPAYLPVVARIAAGGPLAAKQSPAEPSLLTKAANLASAVAAHVAAGLPVLDQAGVDARLAVCAGCDQRLPGGTCGGCGCDLEAPPWRNKAHWADQECPLGKWPGLGSAPTPPAP